MVNAATEINAELLKCKDVCRRLDMPWWVGINQYYSIQLSFLVGVGFATHLFQKISK